MTTDTAGLIWTRVYCFRQYMIVVDNVIIDPAKAGERFSLSVRVQGYADLPGVSLASCLCSLAAFFSFLLAFASATFPMFSLL